MNKSSAEIPRFKPLDATNNFGHANAADTPYRLFGKLILNTDNNTRRMCEIHSISYMAAELGVAPRTVCSAIAELKVRGWVSVIRRRRRSDGKWLANDYEIWADIQPGRPWEYKPRRRKCKPRKQRKQRDFSADGVELVDDGENFAATSANELDDFAFDLVEEVDDELAVEPVEHAVEPVEHAAEPVELAAEPVELAAEPVELAAEPVELAEVWELVERERVMLMDELERDPGHPDDPPREKRDEVSQSFVDLAERAKRRGISQMQGDPLRFVVRVMLAEWLRWRGSDRHPSYLIDRGHSLYCLPGDMRRLRVWFSRKYLEQRTRAPPPMPAERRIPRVILETPFSDEDRSALEALKKVLKPPLGEAAPNSGEKTAKPEPFVRPGCEYPTAAGVCAAHAVDMLEVAEKVYRATCQAHKHALWYLPNEPSSPAGGGGSGE